MTVSGSAGRQGARTDLELGGPLFVYGVVRADGSDHDAVDALTGVEGAPVQLVGAGDLAAAVTLVGPDQQHGRRADLLAYQSVLDALAEAGAVVPMRFGSVLPDAEAVREELLLPDRARLEAILERLGRCRQFNLRATHVEEAVLADLVATDPEVRALRERTRDLPEEASYADRVRLGELVVQALEERSAHDGVELLNAVVPLTVDHVVRTPPSAQQVLDVALLVDPSRSRELVDRLEGLAEAVHERIRLRLVGPLAPYDFVEEPGWA